MGPALRFANAGIAMCGRVQELGDLPDSADVGRGGAPQVLDQLVAVQLRQTGVLQISVAERLRLPLPLRVAVESRLLDFPFRSAVVALVLKHSGFDAAVQDAVNGLAPLFLGWLLLPSLSSFLLGPFAVEACLVENRRPDLCRATQRAPALARSRKLRRSRANKMIGTPSPSAVAIQSPS